jgi:hypothetical protein
VQEGWPIQGGPGSVPVIGDFDGDAGTDLLAVEGPVDLDGQLLWTRATLWTLGAPYRARSDAWTMHRRSADRAATLGMSEDDPIAGALLSEVYCQPNPGGPSGTAVHYRLGAGTERVVIQIYDAAGLEVRRLDGSAFSGVENLVRWNAANGDGDRVAPGLYVYRVTASGGGRVETQVGKLAMVR